MKNAKLVVRLPVFVALLLLGACTSPDGIGTTDRIEITAIRHDRDPASGFVVMNVTANYTLASTAAGIVTLGFDLREPASYQMMADQKVGRGQGTVNLVAEFRPPPGRRLITALVNVSPDPHPRRWSPLVSARQAFSLAAVPP